jgi:hypothetical protein
MQFVNVAHEGQGYPTADTGKRVFIGRHSGHHELVSALTKAKSLATKAGRAERRVVRIQRRIWLAQMLLWPVLIIAGLLGAAWLVVTLRRTDPAPPPDIQLP